jgi:hypothetical protein
MTDLPTLSFRRENDILPSIMTKRPVRKAAAKKPQKGGSSGHYKVVGKLSDGVRILAPKSKPEHFTSKEIKSTIEELRRNSTSGHFTDIGTKRE